MRKQLTKRDFDVPKYYCFVWGGGGGGQKHCTAKLYKCLSYEPFTHIQGTILRANLMRFSNP